MTPPRRSPGFLEQLFQNLKDGIEWFSDKIFNGTWPEKIIAISSVLIIFFVPETPVFPGLSYQGIFYKWIIEYLPTHYNAYFFFVLLILIILALIGQFINIGRRWTLDLNFSIIIIIITILIIFIGLMLRDSQNKFIDEKGNKFSWGEEFLINQVPQCSRETDRKNLDHENYIDNLKDKYKNYLENICPNDPEIQIYNSNIYAKESKNPVGISVAVPITRQNGVEDSQEILRGVAFAQYEWNKEHNDTKIVIGIADDGYLDNDQELKTVTNIGKFLTEKKEVLGVIGHFSSGATETVAPIYKNNNLTAISPTSTAIRQNSDSNQCSNNKKNQNQNIICLNSYILRTSSDDSVHAKKIIDQIKSDDKVAIVYESNSSYSRSFKSAFEKAFGLSSLVKIDDEQSDNCNLSIYGNNKNPKKCLDQSIQNQANTLLLIISSKNSEYANNIIRQNQLLGEKKLKLLASDSMYKEKFVKNDNGEAKKDTKGMIFAIPWHRKDDLCVDGEKRFECKITKLFQKINESKEKYNPLKINWRTATAYDANLALSNGLELSNKECNFLKKITNFQLSQNKCMRKQLKDILLSKKFNELSVEGALGIINFQENGDRKNNNKELGVLVKATDGNF